MQTDRLLAEHIKEKIIGAMKNKKYIKQIRQLPGKAKPTNPITKIGLNAVRALGR